jgi:hypothetical protein
MNGVNLVLPRNHHNIEITTMLTHDDLDTSPNPVHVDVHIKLPEKIEMISVSYDSGRFEIFVNGDSIFKTAIGVQFCDRVTVLRLLRDN